MLFTLLIWGLFLLIYLSGRDNKANKWCAITGFIFSLGTFKEVYFFDVVPKLSTFFGNSIDIEQYTTVYSVMTAILYYTAVPTGVIFSLYFSGYDIRKKDLFKWHRFAIYIPSIVICLFYNPTLTRYYQLNDKTFWYVVSVYNIGYGIILTVLMVCTVLHEKNGKTRRQKKLVNVIILPALWYWLITIFVIHSLGIKQFFKLWKGNVVIVSIVVVYYLIMAFKEGIMGLRLKRENYRWNTDMKMINKSAGYISHLMKNETVKIEWSLKRLESQFVTAPPEEFEIINRSISHVKSFIEKATQYSRDIVLDKQVNCVEDIIKESLYLMKAYISDNISVSVNCPEQINIISDKTHLVEVLNNLISNSLEAMNGTGSINIDVCFDKRRQYFNISIKDTGSGIDQSVIPFIFEPFYTTKRNNRNFGLGLSYCNNVMREHKGYIDIKSSLGCGTTAVLHFPTKYILEGESIEHKEDKNIICRG